MNYMYQTKGLLNLLGQPQVDFSHKAHDNVNESDLPTGLGDPMKYRASWYAPLDRSSPVAASRQPGD